MERIKIAALFADGERLDGQSVTVCGWARTIRDMKTFGFIELNDGSCFRNLQVVMDAEALENYAEIAGQNVGAALVKVICPDKNGTPADVVLGFDEGEAYLENVSFFGCVIGPNANRIADASFCLDGCTYKLDANNGKNNLHSHKEKGWHKRLWKAEVHENDESVTFYLEDGDGSLGFPGNKKAAVTYSLDSENALKLHYHADSDFLVLYIK